MFLGHFAVGLAAKRWPPAMSLGAWCLSVQLVDLLWPVFLLAGAELGLWHSVPATWAWWADRGTPST